MSNLHTFSLCFGTLHTFYGISGLADIAHAVVYLSFGSLRTSIRVERLYVLSLIHTPEQQCATEQVARKRKLKRMKVSEGAMKVPEKKRVCKRERKRVREKYRVKESEIERERVIDRKR